MITVKTHLAIMEDGFTTNTYIVTDEESGETAVVDPSIPEESLMEKLNGKNVKYIFSNDEAIADYYINANDNKVISIGSNPNNNIVFIIGGSNGLSTDVIKRKNFGLSFSSFTFPHQLMRLILIEQISMICKC